MPTLTIANGQTDSGELDLRESGMLVRRNYDFRIPAHGQTVKVYVAPAPSGTYLAINDGFGNDYTLVASKFQYLTNLKVGSMKLIAGAAVTGAQVFTIEW